MGKGRVKGGELGEASLIESKWEEKEPGIWSPKTWMSAFSLAFDLVQDNCYCPHNHHSNYPVFNSYLLGGSYYAPTVFYT